MIHTHRGEEERCSSIVSSIVSIVITLILDEAWPKHSPLGRSMVALTYPEAEPRYEA